MARLPDKYDVGPRASMRQPRPIASLDMGQMGRALEQSGRDIQRVGQIAARKEEEEDRYELAFAKHRLLKSDLETTAELLSNPDAYATWADEYEQRMKAALAEAQRMLPDDPRKRQLFGLDAETTIQRGKLEIQNKARARQKDVGSASTLQMLDSLIQEAPGLDPERRALSLQTARDAINGAVAKGYLGAEEGYKLSRKFGEDYAESVYWTMPRRERMARLFGVEPSPIGTGVVTADVPPDIRPVIEDAAKRHGVDPATLARTAVLESGGDPSARNAASGAAGLFQFMPQTAGQYGLDDPLDAETSADAAARLMSDNKAALAKSLGREPSEAELYLAHQQGAKGAAALLNNPNEPAIDVLATVYGSRDKASRALRLNGGTEDMTAGEFAGKWTQRFDGSEPLESGSADLRKPTGTVLDFLTPEARAKLYERDLKALEIEERRELAAQEKAERRAEKKLKLIGEELGRQLWSQEADGELNREEIERVRPLLPLSEYKALLKAIEPGQEEIEDDPEAFAELYRLVDDDPAHAEVVAYAHHAAGRIKNSTLSTVLEKARTRERQTGPKSAYEQGLSYVRSALEPSPFSQGFTRERAIQAEAIRDFEQWAQTERRTDQEIREYADTVVFNYGQNIGASILDTLPPPLFGERPTQMDDLATFEKKLMEAEVETYQRRESLRPTEYEAQVRLLTRYREVLTRKRQTQR